MTRHRHLLPAFGLDVADLCLIGGHVLNAAYFFASPLGSADVQLGFVHQAHVLDTVEAAPSSHGACSNLRTGPLRDQPEATAAQRLHVCRLLGIWLAPCPRQVKKTPP